MQVEESREPRVVELSNGAERATGVQPRAVRAEAEAPLTPAKGGRVVVAILDDRKGARQARIAADFRKADVIDVQRLTLSIPCKGKPGESDAKYDHRCVRRVTLMLGEGFAPVERK